MSEGRNDAARRTVRRPPTRASARDGGWQGGAAARWKDLTSQVVAVSRRVRVRRAADRDWQRAERAQAWDGDESAALETPGWNRPVATAAPPVDPFAPSDEWSVALSAPPASGFVDDSEEWRALAPSTEHQSWLQSVTRRRLTLRVVAVLAVVSLLIGFCATQTVLGAVDALAAARDAKVQVALLQDTLKAGDTLQAPTLTYMQTRMHLLENDLSRIQRGVPLEPVLGFTPGASGVIHALRMGLAFTRAGEAGIGAGLILIPRLKGALSSLSDTTVLPGANVSTTPTPAPTPTPAAGGATKPPPSALTQGDIDQATADINLAGVYVQEALAERQRVSDGDLQRVGLGSFLKTLHKLDAVTPKLPQYLSSVHTIMTALPALLGLSSPAHYLLFSMDSDELRATGGFLGNFGVLTVAGGKLTGGVKLGDTKLFDCKAATIGDCGFEAVPKEYRWFTTSEGVFSLRDSNLNPDFPTSARLAEKLYTDEGGTEKIDGVIMITPQVFQQIMQVTGPLTIPGFAKTIDATNLQDVLHAVHLANGAPIEGVTAYELGTTGRKTLDTLLGPALLHAVGALTPSQQSDVFKRLFHALTVHDMLVYINNPGVQGLLALQHLDGAVATPPQGDSLYVVDTNIGGNYANADVTQKIADTITLDAKGTASHDLTITYTYPVVKHLYTRQLILQYIAQGRSLDYQDVMRVIVPASATPTTSDCDNPLVVPQDKHAAVGCFFVIYRTQTIVFNYKWTVPNAAYSTADGMQYSLVLQRQPGSMHNSVAITIIAPAKTTVRTPLATSLKPAVANGQVAFTGDLTQDETLTIGY